MARGKKAAPPPSLILERAPHRSNGRRSGGKGASGSSCIAVLLVAIVASVAFPFLEFGRKAGARQRARLTPAVLADMIAVPSHRASPAIDATVLAAQRVAAEEAAARAAEAGDHSAAAEGYRDALELDPTSERALAGLMGSFDAMFGPPSGGPQADRNRSDDFARAMARSVEAGLAEAVSVDPPLFLLRDVASREEARSLLRVAEERRRPWASEHPVVCFDHASFQRHGGLQRHLLHGVGRGDRSCLDQNASAAVAGGLRASESLAVYRGQEPLLDAIGERLHALAGLDPLSAVNFQEGVTAM